VELIMTSEDVIHDFSIPALRIKHDVLPGRYETLWFTANRPGTYHLFCTQFCGLSHAKMVGDIVAMPPPDFQTWLERNGASALAQDGRALYARYGCGGCHGGGGAGGGGAGGDGTSGDEAGHDEAGGDRSGGRGARAVRAPPLSGLYGGPVRLSDGSVVTADERYLHDAIVAPDGRIVAGYPPIMPSFAGQIGEEDLFKLIAFIKSLAPERPQ
jgi:cytochrome c oxidase subunit 2